MTINEIRRELQDRNLTEVSRKTGIAWTTLDDIKRGKRDDMLLSTWQRLVDYLDRRRLMNSEQL